MDLHQNFGRLLPLTASNLNSAVEHEGGTRFCASALARQALGTVRIKSGLCPPVSCHTAKEDSKFLVHISIATVKYDADFPLAMENQTNIWYDKVTRQDAAGLEAFHTDYPEPTYTLLYRGTEPLKITENCRALPVEKFLRELIPYTPLPI